MIGRIIAERYRLEARAGEGGIGAVYKARHLLIDRIVAIKILQPVRRGETHHRDWFLREARAANRVNHANIVDIYDFGDTEDGLYYLVMEYLVGEPLSHLIARGPMPVPRLLDILEQSVAALARAHDLGVVHRDIKSDNVFLVERGGRADSVKVFDFGLAALAKDARLAPEGAVFGTPEYMSPEQTRGEDATPASDLYALGVLAFEMLTGRLPFVSADRKHILKMHQEAPPPSPKQFRADTSDEMERMILRLLQKKVSDRYRDAHHLHEDIKTQMRATPRELDFNPVPAPPRVPTGGGEAAPLSAGGVAHWALRSIMYGRMAAVAPSEVSAAPDVQSSLQELYRASIEVARIENQMGEDRKRVEGAERRAKDARGQFGRQIEDLAGEESRLKRKIAAAQETAGKLREQRDEASKILDASWAEIARLESQGDEAALRNSYERAGASRARFSARAHELAKIEAEIAKMSASCASIASRILELRETLHRQADQLDGALKEMRARLASSNRARAKVLSNLEQSARVLSERLEIQPACRPLAEELHKLFAPPPGATPPERRTET